jgi:rubrerythrin
LKLEDLQKLIKDTITETLKTEDFWKHLETCPECQTKALNILNKIGKIKKEGENEEKIKQLWKKRTETKYKCTECGFPVAPDLTSCPICGSTKATTA